MHGFAIGAIVGALINTTLTPRVMVIGAAIGVLFMLTSGPSVPVPDVAWGQLGPGMTPAIVPASATAPSARPSATLRPTPASPQPSASETISENVSSLDAVVTHREIAEQMAFRAIARVARGLDDCEDDSEECEAMAVWLADIDGGYGWSYNDPLDAVGPGRFTGISWDCSRLTCYAGLLLRDGVRSYVSNP